MAASDASARKLLYEWTVARYLATRPPSHVVTVSTDSTVGEALASLNRHGILSAPLTGENGDVVGVVSIRDVLAAFFSGIYPGTYVHARALPYRTSKVALYLLASWRGASRFQHWAA